MEAIDVAWRWLSARVVAGSYETLSSDVAATLLGGILLTLIFFLVREKLSPVPRVSGVWDVTTTFKTATLPQYVGMEITYRVILLQSGTVVSGTSEKVLENVQGATHIYRGALRVRSVISGGIDKYYLSRSKMHVHMVESGRKRDSTTYFRLKVRGRDRMEGPWDSTAADASGTSIWKRPSS